MNSSKMSYKVETFLYFFLLVIKASPLQCSADCKYRNCSFIKALRNVGCERGIDPLPFELNCKSVCMGSFN